MRLESRLCFLVLVISSVTRGEEQPTVPPGGAVKVDNEGSNISTVPQPQNDASNEANSSTATNQSLASVETVSTPVAVTPGNETTTKDSPTASGYMTTVSPTMVPMPMDPKSPKPVTTTTTTTTVKAPTDASSSWAYVILVIIILVIIILCIILYFLRRASRTYSFDLHRPSPVDHLNVPIGTFEPVYLDDLERPTPKENTTTDEAPPAANGTNLTEEKSSSGQNAAQEHLEVNGLETSPPSNTSNTSNTDPVEPLDGPSLMFADAEEQLNENNNNPSVCSNQPFVEINLDEPVWCDQLLTSPEAPSSVLPFSPFSFSSSSSSS